MEDNKKVYKFLAKSGEDFHLWSARTEAALKAKEVHHTVESDIISDNPDSLNDDVKKAISTACALIIQGLGDRPLRLCLTDKDDPFKMWKRMKDRYAVSNTATRVQLQSRLSRMTHSNQPMGDYIDSFEEKFNRLAGMGSLITEDMQIALFLSSFGDPSRSRYGHIVTSLQTLHDDLSWETVTARLLQDYEDIMWQSGNRRSPAGAQMNVPAQALAATTVSKRRFFGKRNGPNVEKRRCYECRQMGHLAKSCPRNSNRSRKTVQFSESGDNNVSRASPARLLLANVHDIGSDDDIEMYDDMKNSCKAGEDDMESICVYSHAAEIPSGECLLLDSGASDHGTPYGMAYGAEKHRTS